MLCRFSKNHAPVGGTYHQPSYTGTLGVAEFGDRYSFRDCVLVKPVRHGRRCDENIPMPSVLHVTGGSIAVVPGGADTDETEQGG
jgi:hypothetical protein